MAVSTEKLKKYFKESSIKNIHFFENPDGAKIQSYGKNASYECYFYWRDLDEKNPATISNILISPILVPQEKRSKILEFINKLNVDSGVVTVWLDENGIIGCRGTIYANTNDIFDEIFLLPLSQEIFGYIDICQPQFIKLLYTDITPEDAFSELKNCINNFSTDS